MENAGKPEAARGAPGVRERRKSKRRGVFMTTPAFTASSVARVIFFFFILIKELAANEMVEANADQKIIRKFRQDKPEPWRDISES